LRNSVFLYFVGIFFYGPVDHEGAETRPAGPWPRDWPPTVLSRGL